MKNMIKNPKIKRAAFFVSAYALGLITIPILVAIPGFETAPETPGGVPTDLRRALLNITNFVLGFASLVAVLTIIYGGVLYLTSLGNEERVDVARKTIAYAIIGLVIMGLAFAIVQVLVGVILAP